MTRITCGATTTLFLLVRMIAFLAIVAFEAARLNAFSFTLPSRNCYSKDYGQVRTASTTTTTTTTTRRTSFPFVLFSKWDNLVDEDDYENNFNKDDEDSLDNNNRYKPVIPVDMQYKTLNVHRQHNHFIKIREAGGKEMTNDVYVREPNSTQFWFVGKISRVSDVSLEEAVARQWPLIEQHAANLRPLELFPKRGVLELWTAPGDSELEVAYYRPNIIFQQHVRPDIIDAKSIKSSLVGFQGEIYQGGERGFSTLRTNDGKPLKEELSSPTSDAAEQQQQASVLKEPPSDEDMEKLLKALEGKDINEVYEQQQERLRNQQL